MQRSTENSPGNSSSNLLLAKASSSTSAHHPPRGRIELIIGPMFAGKSTELLRRVKRHEIAGSKCLRIKFAGDCRYSDDSIATHDRQTMRAIGARALNEVGDIWKQYDVIGIDEGQFFPDVIEFAEKTSNDGKVVIISALDGTFLRTGFENIINLIPKAEKVKKLAAICKICNQNAYFTFRTILDDSLQLIGGDEAYIPLCRECFNSEHTKQELFKEKQQQQQTRKLQENSPSGDSEQEKVSDKTSDTSSNDGSPNKD